jgi:chromosome segregation ATPase
VTCYNEPLAKPVARMSDLSLLWTIISIIGSVIGSVAVAAWWLKSQLTSAELAGLKEQNTALATWRGFAEAQVKDLTEKLQTVTNKLNSAEGTIQALRQQIAAGADKKQLAESITTSSGAVTSANNDVRAITSDLQSIKILLTAPDSDHWATLSEMFDKIRRTIIEPPKQ